MPIRRIACPTGLALSILFLYAHGAMAQQVIFSDPQVAPRDRVPTPPRTGTAGIKGRVVDGGTGAAVARARVTVQGPNRASMVTDASGSFAFANLPAGSVMLSVDKPTYLSARYPAAGKTIRSANRPLTLANGQVLDNVTVPLFHGGAIMGRVLDANGDPLDNAQVSVMRVPGAGRTGRPTMRAGSSTDDRGEFRVGRLDSGTYILQVSARRNQGPEEMMPGAAPAPPSPQPLPTYYPSALAIEQAQPIVLERGQTVTDIDVVLAEGFPGIITGTVTTTDGSSVAGSNAFVNVRRIMSETPGGFDNFSNGSGLRPDGTFRLTLAPGEYQLEARVTPRTGATRPEDEQFGSMKVVVVSGAEESVAMTVGRGAMATGRVVFEGNAPPPPSPGKMRIPMYSESGMCRSGEATIAADWSFRVEGLAGTCSSPPMGMFGRWMLKAVLVNGNDLADSPFTFETGQQLRNVQVIVTDRRTELSFRITDDNGQPTRDYVVVVYPVEKAQWRTARVFVAPPPMASLNGRGAPAPTRVPGAIGMPPSRRETMTGLRPGEYYVVAVDDLEPDDYRDPTVLDRLRSSATRVTIPDGSTVDVPLRRASFAELMAAR